MESFKSNFEKNHKLHSLVACTLIPNEIQEKKSLITNKSWTNSACTNGLHMNNALYLYTNPPPYGYGTPAPKVAETVIRSYSYNLKTEDKTRRIDKFNVEYTAIQDLNTFNFSETSGNYNPYYTTLMAKSFLEQNHESIRQTAEKIVDWVKSTNCDILSMGNQTWDPAAEKSITNPKAYSRAMEIFQLNLGMTPTTLMEFYIFYFELFCQNHLVVIKTEVRTETNHKTYHSGKRLIRTVLKKRLIRKKKILTNPEHIFDYLINHTRSFCSYIKHAERGKKDRRAIASTGIFLRGFLKTVEEFHLKLGKIIPGSTISIGGEEKKKKILSELRSSTVTDFETKEYKLQGTEDATKWNECLNPLLFGLVHNIWFDDGIRTEMGIPITSENEKLLKKIFDFTFFILSIKRIHLGPGVMITNEHHYTRKEWADYNISELNTQTSQWYSQILHLLEDRNYVFSSPGFLMGMLNACSTTIGLLPSTFARSMDKTIMTLRSSDDSMTVYSASTPEELLMILNLNYKLCKLLGINLSTSKSIFCNEGFGEYTSWYQDGDFVGQSGVETSSLKPGGQNPQEDFNSIAIQTSILLKTYVINLFGATSRLYIGVNNVRRLWRIKKETTKFDIKDEERFLSDGGSIPWNLENCFIDESTLRYYTTKSPDGMDYVLRILNQENPFINPIEERLSYSKDAGKLVLTAELYPTNVFTYIKRSNNTISNETSKLEAELEKANKEAYDIACMIDPSFYLSIPSAKTRLSDFLKSNLALMAADLELNNEEILRYNRAIEKISLTHREEDESDDEEPQPKRIRVDEY